MQKKELEQMLQACEESSLDYFKFVNEAEELVFRRTPAFSKKYGALYTPGTLTQTPVLHGRKNIPSVEENKIEVMKDETDSSDIVTIYSNFIGIVALSDLFKKEHEGLCVKKGEILCVVEAMKIYNEITCSVSGVLEEVLIKDGDMIECEQPLFKIQVTSHE